MRSKIKQKKTGIFLLSALLLVAWIGIYSAKYIQKTHPTNTLPKKDIHPTDSMQEYITNNPTDSYMVSLETQFDMQGKKSNSVTMHAASGSASFGQLPLTCDRVHATRLGGICIVYSGANDDTTMVTLFDGQGHTEKIAVTPGLPTRTRISADGKYAAYTSFTKGDGYADVGFSTRTYIIDVKGKIITDGLESYQLVHNGKKINPIDRNYWGVTFYSDSNHFLATVMYGGVPYLVDGDIKKKQTRVLTKDVECPSLSPDETRIVYKKRIGASGWRLYTMNLKTFAVTPLSETDNVDDQAEWLDNDHVLYGQNDAKTSISTTMVLAADGSGTPKVYSQNMFSPAVLR